MKPVIKKKRERRSFSIGEITRRQLLKNGKGEPYSQKGPVSRILRNYPHTVEQTPHGPAKKYTLDVIIQANLDRKK